MAESPYKDSSSPKCESQSNLMEASGMESNCSTHVEACQNVGRRSLRSAQKTNQQNQYEKLSKDDDAARKCSKSPNRHMCILCEKAFKTDKSLKIHLNHHAEKLIDAGHMISQGGKPEKSKYICQLCKRSFIHNGALNVHMRTHTGERPYKCCDCGRRFSDAGNLQRHGRIHSGEKPFSCTYCTQRFTDHGNLARHIRIHTGEKPYKCDVCQKAFVQSGDLNHHMRVHTGERPFECDLCGKRFIQSSALTHHRRTHTGEKPHQCEECEKEFRRSCDLVRHIRTHTGEKPFSCEVCQQSFSQSGALTQHMKRHEVDPAQLHCKLCKKTFKNTMYYKDHMMIHSGERPYQCSVCQKGFIRLNNLTIHMRGHSREKSYTCHICKKSFIKSNNLTVHMRTCGGRTDGESDIDLTGVNIKNNVANELPLVLPQMENQTGKPVLMSEIPDLSASIVGMQNVSAATRASTVSDQPSDIFRTSPAQYQNALGSSTSDYQISSAADVDETNSTLRLNCMELINMQSNSSRCASNERTGSVPVESLIHCTTVTDSLVSVQVTTAGDAGHQLMPMTPASKQMCPSVSLMMNNAPPVLPAPHLSPHSSHLHVHQLPTSHHLPHHSHLAHFTNHVSYPPQASHQSHFVQPGVSTYTTLRPSSSYNPLFHYAHPSTMPLA